MLKFIRKNRLLSILLLLSFLSLLGGLLLPSILEYSTKDEISKKILKMIGDIKANRVGEFSDFKSVLFNNYSNIIIIWILGISIILIPLIIIIYLSRVILVGLNITFLLINIKSCNILFIIIYLIPAIINVLLLLFLVYFAISYSLILIKLLFFKKQYNLVIINRRYFKVFITVLVLNFINSLFEVFILPKLFLYLI